MGSHSVTCHPTEVRIPPLPPAEAGTRFSDPVGMQGWVDLYYVKATGRELNPQPVNRKSNALPLRHHATHLTVTNTIALFRTVLFIHDIACIFMILKFAQLLNVPGTWRVWVLKRVPGYSVQRRTARKHRALADIDEWWRHRNDHLKINK